MLWLAFPGGGDLPLLLPLALVPLLLAMGAGNGRQAILVGLVAGLVHHLSLLYWITTVLTTYGGLPWVLSFPALFFLALYMSLYWAVFGGLAHLFLATLPPAASLWMLPALWVGLDWLRALLFSGFPWMDLGYALYDIPLAIQSADLFGHYGLTYLIVLTNLLLVLLLRHHQRFRSMILPALPVVAVLLLVTLYSRERLHQVAILTKTAPRQEIGVIQGNIDQAIKWSPEQLQKTVDTHLGLSEKLVQGRAPSLIVWPETSLPFYPLAEPHMARLRPLLRLNNLALLSGVPWLEASTAPGQSTRLYNSALLLKPDGRVAGTYHKSHLVPFGEYVPLQEYLPFLAPLVEAAGNFSAGTIDRPLEHGKARLGILICFESVFPDLTRQWLMTGANLLVNLTNDAWYGRSSAPHHSLAMAVLRAVEARRSLVRSANTGISAFIEPTGEILLRSELFEPWAESREVAILEAITFWAAFGHRFAPACLIVSIFSLPVALVIRRRRQN